MTAVVTFEETQNGLGRHVFAATPEMFTGLLKVKDLCLW